MEMDPPLPPVLTMTQHNPTRPIIDWVLKHAVDDEETAEYAQNFADRCYNIVGADSKFNLKAEFLSPEAKEKAAKELLRILVPDERCPLFSNHDPLTRDEYFKFPDMHLPAGVTWFVLDRQQKSTDKRKLKMFQGGQRLILAAVCIESIQRQPPRVRALKFSSYYSSKVFEYSMGMFRYNFDVWWGYAYSSFHDVLTFDHVADLNSETPTTQFHEHNGRVFACNYSMQIETEYFGALELSIRANGFTLLEDQELSTLDRFNRNFTLARMKISHEEDILTFKCDKGVVVVVSDCDHGFYRLRAWRLKSLQPPVQGEGGSA
jgi:hypothetical protein